MNQLISAPADLDQEFYSEAIFSFRPNGAAQPLATEIVVPNGFSIVTLAGGSFRLDLPAYLAQPGQFVTAIGRCAMQRAGGGGTYTNVKFTGPIGSTSLTFSITTGVTAALNSLNEASRVMAVVYMKRLLAVPTATLPTADIDRQFWTEMVGVFRPNGTNQPVPITMPPGVTVVRTGAGLYSIQLPASYTSSVITSFVLFGDQNKAAFGSTNLQAFQAIESFPTYPTIQCALYNVNTGVIGDYTATAPDAIVFSLFLKMTTPLS